MVNDAGRVPAFFMFKWMAMERLVGLVIVLA